MEEAKGWEFGRLDFPGFQRREFFQMPQKLTKTRAELEILLMAELRTYPECSNVDAVAITRPVGRLWGVAVMRDGPLIRLECRKRIWEITERLCNKYDLAQEPPLAGAESTSPGLAFIAAKR